MGKPPKGVGPYPDTWHIPGGGVELGKESLIEALRREVKEETNIEITDIIPIGFSEDREPNKHGEMTHYIFLIHYTIIRESKKIFMEIGVMLQDLSGGP